MTDEHVLQTIDYNGRTIRKVWRDDEEGGYDAFQYQSGKEWRDFEPTVQEALAFVAAKLSHD